MDLTGMARATSSLAAIAAVLLACAPDAPQYRSTAVVEQGAYNPSVSSDGSTIAVGILGKIWLLPVTGGEARQLTFGGGWDHHPVWSPDGRQLAYVHDTPASSQIVLHTFARGTSRTLYGRSPKEVAGRSPWGPVFTFGQLAFHPDNGRLYFSDFRSGIWSVDLTGRTRPTPEQLLPGSGRIGRPGITEYSSFAISPEGDRLVVEKDTTDLWSMLHFTPLDSADFTAVTPLDRVKRTSVGWSPDGSALVYLVRQGAREEVAIHQIDTGEDRRIELGAFNGREITLHPDGRRVVVVSGRRLFMLDLASGLLSEIPFQASLALSPRTSGDLVITNARLFDGSGGPVIDGATVEIIAGKIVSVSAGPAGAAAPAPRGTADLRVIDAGGRFLMPGLVASHSHLWGGDYFAQASVVTRGVTSLFDPGSYLPQTLNLRDAIELGLLEGPNIYTSGPTIDGPGGRARPFIVANVTDPAEVQALVRELHAQGVDAIKSYAFLEPEVLAAAIEEAHRVGLPVIGDLVTTPWRTALEAGIDGFVHVMDHKWRFVAREQPDPAEGPWAVVEPDSALMEDFFAAVAAAGAMFDPTIMASSRLFDAEPFAAALQSGDGADDAVRRVATLADMLRTMHRRGVKWVAGTDTGPADLLDELEIYQAIGIPNDVILQTATANAARWLNKDDFGTIAPGMRADLILVDGDPLEQIRDLENVVLVVQGGRVALEH